jgi:hypothetical protein
MIDNGIFPMTPPAALLTQLLPLVQVKRGCPAGAFKGATT